MNKTVLIIEDDEDLVNLVKTSFELEGFKVYVSKDIKHALESLSKNKVDLLFADVVVQDGKTLDHINEFLELNPTLKIILTSGYYEFINRIRLSENTVFTIKPYDINKVLASAKALLSDK
ncbi:MAG: hypothetical protein COT17_01045 [Elusimicrobia bacterium CG08_land_8_20_14_0_20_51_18]|nr:MAG: hypothetical protein COT17_01045 [Elusimicrobia bacterium CG08_land_8_20_14_0_20_51_18]